MTAVGWAFYKSDEDVRSHSVVTAAQGGGRPH